MWWWRGPLCLAWPAPPPNQGKVPRRRSCNIYYLEQDLLTRSSQEACDIKLTYCFSGYLLCYRFGYSVGSSPHFLKFQLTSSFTPFAAGKSRGTNRKKHTRARLACVAGGIVTALASRGFIPKTSLARGRKFHQLRRLRQDKQRVWSLIWNVRRSQDQAMGHEHTAFVPFPA